MIRQTKAIAALFAAALKEKAQARYDAGNARLRKGIETVRDELKKK